MSPSVSRRRSQASGAVHPEPLRSTVLLAALLATLLAASYTASCADTRAMPSGPSVVLIVVDTLRADALEIHGGTPGVSPHLAALAERSVVFDRAFTPIGTTNPAHASLFTGLYPKRHGVQWNGDRLDDRFSTLAEVFRDAGYDTAAISSWPRLTRHGGLGQGFEVTQQELGPWRDRARRRSAEEVVELVDVWMSRRRDSTRPFLLWVHLNEPHSPYPVRPTVSSAIEESSYDGSLRDGATVEEFYALEGRRLDPEERSVLRALYDGAVSAMDDAVGQLLRRLRAGEGSTGLVVVLTADHGQLLGEHDEVGHGWKIWNQVMHVPLIVNHPDIDPLRISDPVGLIDLRATLVELAGLTADGGDGRSLVPLMNGSSLEERPLLGPVRRVAEVGGENGELADNVWALVGGRSHHFRHDGLLVFDLEVDPGEEQPLPPPEEREMRVLTEMVERYRRLATTEAPADAIAEELRRELEDLGYL